MKNPFKFLPLTLILFLNQGLSYGEPIQPVERSVGKLQISIDPRMELLSTIQLLSNYPVVNGDLPYSKEILEYFKLFNSEKAVKLTEKLFDKHGFAYDAPVRFMLYLSNVPELEENIEFSDYLLARSGKGNNLEEYRKSIKQFAEVSNFETFWNSKIPFYNRILDMTIAEIEGTDFVKTLENYYNETQGSYNIIIVSAFWGGYGPKIPGNDGKYHLYACLGVGNTKDSIPYLNSDNLRYYVWHEFGHSFVNPLSDKYSDQVNAVSKLFEPIKSRMSSQAYGNWKICVNEHIIRAITTRFSELYDDAEQSKIILNNEIERRFIYIEPLIEKLKEFEIQRDEKNITFSEFYPELLNVFDSLQKIEYWKQFNLNFAGPINAVSPRGSKTVVIYPTKDSDKKGLKIAQKYASDIYEMFHKNSSDIILSDKAALKKDLSEYEIVAYGTIESNLFLKKHASSFPFRIENQTIYADKEYTDKNIKLITCIPNPFNPQKGMSIYTALSNTNIHGINSVFHGPEDYILFLNSDTIISKGFYKKEEEWKF